MKDEFARLFHEVSVNMTAVGQSSYVADLERAVDLMVAAFAAGQKLLVFGNGGSSADAQHFTAELVGRFTADRRPLPAIALTTNQAVLTAWSNDHSFDDVFARQVEALGVPGDVALGISTSGNSANVVNALAAGRARRLKTIGVTGVGGGKVAQVSDVLLAVPLSSTARVQEVHSVTFHAMCGAIEARLLRG